MLARGMEKKTAKTEAAETSEEEDDGKRACSRAHGRLVRPPPEGPGSRHRPWGPGPAKSSREEGGAVAAVAISRRRRRRRRHRHRLGYLRQGHRRGRHHADRSRCRGEAARHAAHAEEELAHRPHRPGLGPDRPRRQQPPWASKAQPYKLLAEALAEARASPPSAVDKRGMFGSAPRGRSQRRPRSNSTRRTIAPGSIQLRAQTGRDCIFLLGHSEGALMVSAAAEGRKDVCGLILVSGMGRKFGDIIREQLKANPANAPCSTRPSPPSPSSKPAAMSIRRRHAPCPAFRSSPRRCRIYMISLMAADPIETLRKARRGIAHRPGTARPAGHRCRTPACSTGAEHRAVPPQGA